MSPDEGQEELEEVQAEIKKKDEEVSQNCLWIMSNETATAFHLQNCSVFGVFNHVWESAQQMCGQLDRSGPREAASADDSSYVVYLTSVEKRGFVCFLKRHVLYCLSISFRLFSWYF